MVHLGENHKIEHVFGSLPKTLPISLSIMAVILAFTAGRAWSALPSDMKDKIFTNDVSQERLLFLLSVAGNCLSDTAYEERIMTQSLEKIFRSPADEKTLCHAFTGFGICIPLSPLIKTRRSKNHMHALDADPRQQMAHFNAMCHRYDSHGIEKHSSWKSHV